MPPRQTLRRRIRRQLRRTPKWRLRSPRTSRSGNRLTISRNNLPRYVTAAQSGLHRPRNQRTTTQHPNVLARYTLRTTPRKGTTENSCHRPASLSGHTTSSFRRNLVFPANPPRPLAYIPPSRHRSSPAISQPSNTPENAAFPNTNAHPQKNCPPKTESVQIFIAISRFPVPRTTRSVFTTIPATHYPPLRQWICKTGRHNHR